MKSYLKDHIEVRTYNDKHGEILIDNEAFHVLKRLVVRSELDINHRWNSLRIWLHTIVVTFVSFLFAIVHMNSTPLYSAFSILILVIYFIFIYRLNSNLNKEEERVEKAMMFMNSHITNESNNRPIIQVPEGIMGFRFVTNYEDPDDFLKDMLYKTGCLEDTDVENVGLNNYNIVIVDSIGGSNLSEEDTNY